MSLFFLKTILSHCAKAAENRYLVYDPFKIALTLSVSDPFVIFGGDFQEIHDLSYSGS
jgi:hypothetical protein